MSLKPGTFIIVAFAFCLTACLCATESKAQVIPRGYARSGLDIARYYVGNTRHALQNGQVVQYGTRNGGVRFGGGQGFRAGTQRWGAQFGNGNGLQAGRLIQTGRIISRF